MRAIVLDGHGSVQLAELPEPVAGPRDVVIAPQAVGICGTDLHLCHGEYPTGKFPVVPGHEFAGTVVAIGSAVERFKIGDQVCVDPNVACGHCEQCRLGAVNLCLHLVPIGVTSSGACAERVSVPEKVVYPLPSGLDMGSGALIEPLACVLHGFRRAPTMQDRRILIYGAGSIGLLATAVARAEGASRIEIIEPSAVRRQAAQEFGASHVFAPGEREGTRDVDIVIEASGHIGAVADAITRLANRGTLLQMGVCKPDEHIHLHPYDLFDRELSLTGSQSLESSYPDAIRKITDLPDLAKRMVSHTFALADFADALEAARSEGARKVQILPQQ
ncbi:zinc-binding dehydrogenase [Pseudomonas syringae pv. avellanae str. ISPaVe013]|uniref:alcohol dehydrogenase catalytic domain-containing protein n=1 Tax=Pseudomonas syringae TaxID=317 RepID=UPI00028DAC19|nr:alcohol dehydrogenase catalytic domain-containing protein [Pseudomonas syringae]EKG40175.1 zinc-binding dehydrogenase [Pseudomonas syringae pv. avellanae str. ISPaVe013]